MKKFIIVIVALLLVSWVTYGETWTPGAGKIYVEPTTTKVGIGTTSPSLPLHVYLNSTSSSNVMRVGNAVDAAGEYAGIELWPGNYCSVQILGILLSGTYRPSALAFYTHPDAPAANEERMRIDHNGNVGIGTTSPAQKLHIYQNTNADLTTLIRNNYNGKGAYLSLQANSNYAALLIAEESGTGIEWIAGEFGSDNFSIKDANNHIFQIEPGGVANTLYLKNNGRVGIGTPTPQSELAVNGTITAKEVIVTLDGWPDFVFEDNYRPMPLNKLEKYIKINKNLPGIPKEKEVAKEGVALGEMQAKLLAKVEELTLYVINQNKELNELKKENEGLKERISALEK